MFSQIDIVLSITMSSPDCKQSTIKALQDAKKVIRGINKKTYEENGSIGTVLVQKFGECVGKTISGKFLGFGKVVCMSKTWEPIAAKKEVLIKAIDEKISKLKQSSKPSKKQGKKYSGGDSSWLQSEQRLESFSLFGGDYLA